MCPALDPDFTAIGRASGLGTLQIINDDTEKLPHFPIPQIGALSLHHTATTASELAASAQCPRSGSCYVEVSHGPGLGLVPPPASTSAQL